MTIADLMSDAWTDLRSFTSLGPFIRENGIDLCTEPLSAAIGRGTPLYVAADADPIAVQRRMAQVHAKMLFVLDRHDTLLGVIDFWNLASRSETLDWTTGMSRPVLDGPSE